VQGHNGARVPIHIDQTTAGAMAEFCRARGATTFMVLVAALAALLHRLTGARDVAVGTAVAGRTADTEALIGVFINTIMIRTSLDGVSSFAGLVERARAAVLGALAHQELPFERLVDALQVPRELSRAPLCQVLLVLHNTPSPRLNLAGLEIEAVEIDPGTAKLDLTLELRESEGGIGGSLEYNTELFDQPTAARMAGDLVGLLASGLADPQCRLADLAASPEAQPR
jgi:non-ribosomal peptide synthetase component F